MSGSISNSIVFLDRDGTINVDTGYVCNPDEVVLLDGAAEAIALLKKAGYLVIIVTNQSAIGRGYASSDDVEATNARVLELLRAAYPDAEIDEVLYCPHSPDDACPCRKPERGMLDGHGVAAIGIPLEFSAEELSEAWIVGDKMSDLEFGKNIGIPFERRILLDPSCQESLGESAGGSQDDSVAPLTYRSLLRSVRAILGPLPE